MNYIDLHFHRIIKDLEILNGLSDFYKIDKKQIVITKEIKDILKYNNYLIWSNKVIVSGGDFPFTLSIYPQSKKYDFPEIKIANYLCNKFNTKCVIIPPEKAKYGEWLLIMSDGENKIITEDLSADIPDDEDWIVIKK